jgi:hypothetical protein
VLQVDGIASGVPDRFIIETLPIAGATTPCPVTLGPAPASLPSTGATSGIAVTTAANCFWRVTTAEPWIEIVDDVGIGSGTATIAVASNYSTVSRTGKVAVNGVEIAISQGPGAPVSGALPQIIEPSSGSFRSQTFAVRLTNAAGLSSAYVSFGNSPAGPGTCTVEFNRAANSFRLLDDTATSWSSGDFGAFANSQCGLIFPTAYVSGSMIVLTLPIDFSGSFVGQRDVSVIALDPQGSSGWRKRGSYNIVAVSNASEVGVVTMLPESGSGNVKTFTGIFKHTGGVGQLYLGYMLFLRTPNIVSYTAKSSCLVEYNRISNGMRLINDAGDDWLGPLIGIPVGTPGARLTNAQCSLDIGAAKATARQDTMVVEAPVTFHSASPVTMTFLQAFDVIGRYTGMTQMGTWITGLPATPAPGPAIASVTRTSSGNSHTFSINASHTGGASKLASLHLRFGATIVAPEFCHVYYLPAENAINLVGDAGTPAGANLPLGGAGTLSNSRCTVTAAGATRVVSGDALAVTLPVLFHNVAAFEGDRNVYVNAFDVFGNLTHWVSAGSVRVQ